MSNLQGWNYIEEQLSRYYMEERMKHQSTEHTCSMCTNQADYLVTGYDKSPFDQVFYHPLCAKHNEQIRKIYKDKGSTMKFTQELI